MIQISQIYEDYWMFPPSNKVCVVFPASVHPRLKSWDDKLSTIINKHKFLSAHDLQSWVGKMMIEEEFCQKIFEKLCF